MRRFFAPLLRARAIGERFRWGLASGTFLLLLSLLSLAVRKPRAEAPAQELRTAVTAQPEAPAASVPSADLGAPAPVPLVRKVPVSGEEPALVAPAEGSSRRVVVYLHGFCSDAHGVVEWAQAVQKHATLIAPHGELACDGQPGRYRWGNDIRFADYRIQRAVRSVSKSLGRELERDDVTIAGYSEGADRAESLAWLFPSRYRRAVLMSGPDAPRFDKLRRAERVAVLRGEREYRTTYRMAAEHFDRAGLSARFWELPGAAHGELGPRGPEVLREVFDFVER